MRLCILGNSHAAAWKLAWDQHQSSFNGTTIRFFAAPGGNLKALTASNGKLIADRPKLQKYLQVTAGCDSISPDEYDAFCILACGTTVLSLLKVYRGYRTENHRGLSEEQELISEPCFDAAAASMVAENFAFDLQRSLESVTSKPIFLVPQPMPSEAILSDPSEGIWRRAHEAGDESNLAASFLRVLDKVGEGRLHIVSQPEGTLKSGLLTDKAYSEGSVRLKDPAEEHPENDYLHMNAEFGLLALRHFIAAAAKVGQGSPPQ